MPFVPRPTFRLFYEDLGPRGAPVVVLMPSFLCDGSMFTHLATRLSQRYRVLNVDLRGHGRSTVPTRGYTLEDQADDIVAALDHAEVDRAVMGGVSQGGMTALRLALYHPKRVRALALLNSSAGVDAPTTKLRHLALATVFRAVGVAPAIERRVVPMMFSPAFVREHGDRVAHEVASWRVLDRTAVVRSLRAITLRTDLLPRLVDIEVPTLVVAGEADAALPVAHSEGIARGIRGAQFEVLAGAGHLSTIEQPEATTALVTRFVDRVFAS